MNDNKNLPNRNFDENYFPRLRGEVIGQAEGYGPELVAVEPTARHHHQSHYPKPLNWFPG